MEEFTNKEKTAFFKAKWKQEHNFERILAIVIAAGLFLFGVMKDNGVQYIAIIGICIYNILWNNRMMSYVEEKVYMEKYKKKGED